MSNQKTCNVCEEDRIEVDYHLLFYMLSYDDILRGGDDLSVTIKRAPRKLRSYVYALITH